MAEIKNKKVVVAMSGGVDSSVAAALLKKQGYDVIGVFMKFWAPRSAAGKENRCCTLKSEKRARLVAKKIGIPFYVFNFGKEFKKRVVDYFLKEIKAGKTPNPCVVCNKEIKFGLLLEKALKLNADYVATGHYARKVSSIKYQVSSCKLLRGKDKEKDQSYFLWQLNQKQLSRILFPVGNYTKEEVRKLAGRFKLPVAKTSESMEVCFIPATINDFLKKYLKTKPGPICLTSGVKQEIIGRHQGLWLYTIGQRKGIGIASVKPYYVLDKDFKKNLLIVTQNEKDLYKKELIAKEVNWVAGQSPKFPLKVMAKIRYRSPSVPIIARQFSRSRRPREAIVRQKKGEKNKIKIIFQKPQRAITPGQSVVFYAPAKAARDARDPISGDPLSADKGEELLGGGIIA